MQVKKFEAESMKDALALVKTDFGPQAIVLSTRERQRGYGKGSVFEITAAVSKSLLQKKKLAESKLNEETKKKFLISSAKNQKKFIEEVFNDFKGQKKGKALTKMPYAFIEDQEGRQNKGSPDTREVKKEGKDSFSQTEVKSISYPPFSLIKRRFGDQKIAYQKEKDFKSSRPLASLSNKSGSLETQNLNQSSNKKMDTFISKSSLPDPVSSGSQSIDLGFIYEKLSRIGISYENIDEIVEEVKKEIFPTQIKNKNLIEAFVARFFLDHIRISKDLFHRKYQIFIGPSGSGKTTSLIQVATRMIMERKKKVVLLSFSGEKIGSFEVFKIFSNILNVPFFKMESFEDLKMKEEELKEADFVLVDFFSLDFQSKENLKKGISYFPEDLRVVHYVESLMFDEKNSFDLLNQSKISFDDVIFTHLNGSKSYGKIHNFQKLFNTPLHSFCFGENIPDDFEWATKERFVDLVFQLVNWGDK